MEERLIEIFKEYLPAWSWEEWQAAGSSDREEIVINAIADLGPEVDIDEAYDIFYDWAAGLTEADFGETITEASRSVASRYGSTGWYSGYASGLNDISNRVDDKERAQIAAAEEERRQKQAAQRAAYRAAKEERETQRYLTKAQEAIAAGTIDEYNYEFVYEIRTRDYCPAIDPVTKELIYDPKQKEEILKPVDARKEEEEAERRKKEAERRARAKADAARTYTWIASYVINGRTFSMTKRVVGNKDPESAASMVSNIALKRIAQEAHECKVFKEPFSWDGKLSISYKTPDGNTEFYKDVDTRKTEALEKLSFVEAITELDDLYEAKRVMQDADALYHYTNPLPFCRILKSDSLRMDINEGAVCFTTDANYRIYGCPIGLQFSRQKLINAGYELEEYDDYQPEIYGDDRAEDASTESEERVYETVKGIKKLLTAVHVHWSPEGMTQDQAPDSIDYPFIDVAQSARGDIIGDDNPNAASLADSLVWKISMSYFRRQLRELQAAGIKIYEYGTPMKDIYWLDENNKLHEGPMPEVEKEED